MGAMASEVGAVNGKRWSVPAWLVFTVALLLFLGITTTAVSLYQLSTNAAHNKKALRDELRTELCATVRVIIAPGGPPPTTERGSAVASSMRGLYTRLGC